MDDASRWETKSHLPRRRRPPPPQSIIAANPCAFPPPPTLIAAGAPLPPIPSPPIAPIGIPAMPPPREGTRDDGSGLPMVRMRIGAKDRRKLHMKGYVEIEPFQIGEYAGSFVVLARDVGNPLEWRAMWKELVKHPLVNPHVYKKSG